MRASFLLLLCFLAPLASAEQFAVVVAAGSQIEALDEGKIRDIFLKKRGFDHGVRLVPVNLLGDGGVRAAFESSVLRMNRDEINRYWIANHFQGVSPPATQASLASIRIFVVRVNGAIGYLPLDMVDDSVRVLHEF